MSGKSVLDSLVVGTLGVAPLTPSLSACRGSIPTTEDRGSVSEISAGVALIARSLLHPITSPALQPRDGFEASPLQMNSCAPPVSSPVDELPPHSLDVRFEAPSVDACELGGSSSTRHAISKREVSGSTGPTQNLTGRRSLAAQQGCHRAGAELGVHSPSDAVFEHLIDDCRALFFFSDVAGLHDRPWPWRPEDHLEHDPLQRDSREKALSLSSRLPSFGLDTCPFAGEESWTLPARAPGDWKTGIKLGGF